MICVTVLDLHDSEVVCGGSVGSSEGSLPPGMIVSGEGGVGIPAGGGFSLVNVGSGFPTVGLGGGVGMPAGGGSSLDDVGSRSPIASVEGVWDVNGGPVIVPTVVTSFESVVGLRAVSLSIELESLLDLVRSNDLDKVEVIDLVVSVDVATSVTAEVAKALVLEK